MSKTTETMKAAATVELKVHTDERPFTHVDRFELVEGVEVWKSVETKLQSEVTLDKDPVPTVHPVAYLIDKAILWAPDEERFYLFGPCHLPINSPGSKVKPRGWYQAIVGGPAPNGSTYSPRWHHGTKVGPVSHAEAFYHLAEEWKWSDVVKGFGPVTDAPVDEAHVSALHAGAAQASMVGYEALSTRDRARHLSRVAEEKLLGALFTAENVMAPLADEVYRESVQPFFLKEVGFPDLCDRWRAVRAR